MSIPRGLVRPLAALLLPAAAAVSSRAALLNGADQSSVVPSGPMVGAPIAFLLRTGIPTEPLSDRLSAVKTAAGYLRYSRSIANDGSNSGNGSASNGAFAENERGPGLAAAYVRGFGPHWGMSVTAAVARTAGGLTKNTPFRAVADGPDYDESATLGVSAIYDPFSDPKGFHLPVALGLADSYVAGKRGEIDFVFPPGNGAATGHNGQIVERYSGNVPSLFLGIGPQGDVGDFRLGGFLYADVALRRLKDSYAERDLTTGVSTPCTTDAGSTTAVGSALEAQYRPWGLSLIFAPPIALSGSSQGALAAYAVAWTKRW